MRARFHFARRLVTFVALFTLPLGLSACGDSEEMIDEMPPARNTNPPPSQTGSSGSSNRGAPSPESMNVLDLSPVKELQPGEGWRDPFERSFPDAPVAAATADEDLPEEEAVIINTDRSELAQFAPTQLQLMGIVSRQALNVAMFRVPGDNRAVFAIKNDPVGPNGSGYISDIQSNMVIVTYERFNRSHNEYIPLREPGDLEEQSDFERY